MCPVDSLNEDLSEYCYWADVVFILMSFLTIIMQEDQLYPYYITQVRRTQRNSSLLIEQHSNWVLLGLNFRTPTEQ